MPSPWVFPQKNGEFFRQGFFTMWRTRSIFIDPKKSLGRRFVGWMIGFVFFCDSFWLVEWLVFLLWSFGASSIALSFSAFFYEKSLIQSPSTWSCAWIRSRKTAQAVSCRPKRQRQKNTRKCEFGWQNVDLELHQTCKSLFNVAFVLLGSFRELHVLFKSNMYKKKTSP